jgi:hypothetical protein
MKKNRIQQAVAEEMEKKRQNYKIKFIRKVSKQIAAPVLKCSKCSILKNDVASFYNILRPEIMAE